MPQWADELADLIKKGGANDSTRLIDGVITSVSPLKFKYGEVELSGLWDVDVADQIAIGDRVLAIQRMEDFQIFVIARLL